MRVPEPGFFLKRAKSTEATSIIMVVRIGSEILKYYTRESINPSDWDPVNKRAKEGKYYPEGWEINMRLQKYRLKFKTFYRDLVDRKIMPTRALLRTRMDEEFFDFIKKPSGLVKYFEDVIKRMEENRILTDEGKPYAKGTLQTFNTAIKHLKIFEEQTGRILYVDGIDMAFYYEYLDYFYSNNYATNGIFNPIKKLKQVLKIAEQEGFKVDPAYRNKRFIAPAEITDKIYLTEAEINKIYNVKYELFSQIDAVRDRFILACCTGVRFSDYEEISPENIFKNEHGEFCNVRAQKTNVKAVIPLNWMAKAILAKYEYRLPAVIGNANFNDYLKKIGADASIDDEIKVSITRGGVLNSEIKKKHELIQTHTARRSFATNLFIKGYPALEIMKVTGHKTETEFLKYIRVSSEEVAFKIAKDPRFSNRDQN